MEEMQERIGWLEYWDAVKTQLEEHGTTLGGNNEVYQDWKEGKTIDESVKSYL